MLHAACCMLSGLDTRSSEVIYARAVGLLPGGALQDLTIRAPEHNPVRDGTRPWIVAHQRLHAPPRIVETPSGMLNAIGLARFEPASPQTYADQSKVLKAYWGY